VGHREDLEAALRASPDLDTMAVYADVLEAAGDPRGELMAIVLADRAPDRVAGLVTWLTAELAQRAGGVADPHLFVTGAGDLPWLASPLGEFVRGIAMMARVEQCRRVVAAVASRPRPWFRLLRLTSGFGVCELPDVLAAATPHLEELDLTGGVELTELVHPSVHTLRLSVSSTEGAASLLRPYYLPAVTHLDLELSPWPNNVRSQHLVCDHLPALTSLDLSRTEPTYGAMQRGFNRFDALAWLRDVPLRHRLETVKLPAIRTQRAADHVEAILAEVPGLTATAARAYSRCSFGAGLARLTLPEPWPWPPADTIPEAREDLLVKLPGGTVKVSQWMAISELERTWHRLSVEERDAWRQVWATIDTAVRREVALPYGVLARAYGCFVHCDPLVTIARNAKAIVDATPPIADATRVTLRAS
jgi:hypothetical protein